MHPIRNEKDLDTLRRSVSAYGALCAWTGHNLFEKLVTEIGTVISGKHAGLTSTEEITLFD